MSEDHVSIERTFSADRATVWEQWASAENFAGWYGPPGATIAISTMDVEVGGRRHFSMDMQGPNGPMSMWFVGAFAEIEPTSRLVYTETMGDEAGEATSPDTRVVVELSDTDGGGTQMSMTHEGVPADSPGAMGWKMAIDKLAARLEG